MTVQTDFLKRCKALNLHDGKLSDWLDNIESLHQQLANRELEVQHVLGKVVLVEQQLAAALAACELKDEALQNCEGMLDELRDYPITHDAIIEALALQPDDSALKAGLGDPVEYQYQGRDGKWKPFIDDFHKDNTIASGDWPVRELYEKPKWMNRGN